MQLDNFDLVASLQALPETNPVEIDGIQFGGNETCAAVCVTVLTVNAPTVCVGVSCQ